MKTNTWVLAASLAMLVASTAHGQESSRLSADDLRHATPLIHWPKGLEPHNVDVFVHNEGWIDAPPEIVWANLIEAVQWPNWYSNSADVHIDADQQKLTKGATFHWKTFGFPVTSTVDVFEPNREIGWNVQTPTFSLHHAWLLIPERGGTRVITEEAQKGPVAINFHLEQPNAMHDGHDWWMSALKARSEKMAKN
ncbi:SRPBCC family protein [Dyella flava]|uniref:SRPBCC family protein n=1 Tax=Dyella flava TaxID=1920170 RepID=A0ABS2JYR1_9GAMM|nr:SRPBCC family protein [Dyella flava]MBM7124139.1 SRPBCC family protein [Dyella flava]GLQ50042.1 polyketide cyclase [Dyella flava]